jgi:HNH endonuclease
MAITAEIRLFVRQRAHFACEYCGVSELQAGGELTIDHHRPLSKGGDDHPDNLVYCCARCNQQKGEYWPNLPEDVPLWNPRLEPPSHHFHVIGDGNLISRTDIGTFTLRRLNLNRTQLVARRCRLIRNAEKKRLLDRRRELIAVRLREMRKNEELNETQRALLSEMLDLLRSHFGTLSGEGEDDDF